MVRLWCFSFANKFLQKIWNLNHQIIKRKTKEINQAEEKLFKNNLELYIYKIDSSINNFQFNVAIAQFHEIFKYFRSCIDFKIGDKIFLNSLTKIMKLMIPFTPHLAFECLENLKCKDTNKWPKINATILNEIKINLVIQINGKTRDVLSINKDSNEEEINKLVNKSSKAQKYLMDKKIIKTIFVKNKIINYITNG